MLRAMWDEDLHVIPSHMAVGQNVWLFSAGQGTEQQEKADDMLAKGTSSIWSPFIHSHLYETNSIQAIQRLSQCRRFINPVRIIVLDIHSSQIYFYVKVSPIRLWRVWNDTVVCSRSSRT